ncbi:MAG: class I SAM-dependent methyltransferase [Pontibacterium sp.]
MNLQPQPELRLLAIELNEWFQSELGRQLLAAEVALLNRFLPTIFGYDLLEISGAPQAADLTPDSPIHAKYRLFAAPHNKMGARDFVGDADGLPFAQNSMDAVVLHHILDFAQSPHQVLKEATRVLRPGGQMLIITFNPMSSWGLYRNIKHKRRKHIPWRGHFISHRRLQDWFALLELTELRCRSDFFDVPFAKKRRYGMGRFIESACEKYFHDCGAFNLLLVRKDVASLTLLPKLKFRKPILPIRAVKPTIRERTK